MGGCVGLMNCERFVIMPMIIEIQINLNLKLEEVNYDEFDQLT